MPITNVQSSPLIKQAQRDLKNDGKINKAEAKALIALANKDGKVTSRELGDLSTILDDYQQTTAGNRVLSDYLRGRD